MPVLLLRCCCVLACLGMLGKPLCALSIAPLGIGMEGFPYPHPVHWFDLRMEGEPVRMAYMDVEPQSTATGRTVLLLHGRNFFGGYWEHTIHALADAGYRVVVPDQIGFGKSSKPDVPHSLHLHAQNTRQLLDALGVHEVDLIGHSLGGMMALRFALMYPDRVSKMVLESPLGLEDYRLKVPYATREELAREHAGTSREGFERLFRGFFARWKPEYEGFIDVQHRWQLGPEARWIARTAAQTYQMAYEQPVVYELGQVSAPTLIVAGDQDRTAIGRNRVAPAGCARPWACTRNSPGGRHVRYRVGRWSCYRGVGHVPHLEVPERFYAEVLHFLKR